MRHARAWLRALGVAGVIVAVIAVRVVTSAHAELDRGESAEARGDVDAAILAYRRAARWYAPGNPYCVRALDRLERIARAAEADANADRALAAWRSARGAILSSRSVVVPHRERLQRAEDAIVTLSAEAAPSASRRDTRDAIRSGFDEPERPSVVWTLVLLAGWIAWTIGAFAFAQLALDEEDRLRPRPARAIGTVVVVGFGLFVLGMALA